METGKTNTRVERLYDLIERLEFKIKRGAQPELKKQFELEKRMHESELAMLEAREELMSLQTGKVKK